MIEEMKTNRQKPIKNKEKSKLQIDRHRIALEKLQLAWMKKTLTLSGLGFVAYRFFYSRIESGNAPLLESFNGRVLGMFLISLGIFGLFQATIQHIRNYTELKIRHDRVGYSVALVQSVILLIFFLFLLLLLILKF
jgi:uncharacterized membrane protein YidH (DUF202 family)